MQTIRGKEISNDFPRSNDFLKPNDEIGKQIMEVLMKHQNMSKV